MKLKLLMYSIRFNRSNYILLKTLVRNVKGRLSIRFFCRVGWGWGGVGEAGNKRTTETFRFFQSLSVFS